MKRGKAGGGGGGGERAEGEGRETLTEAMLGGDMLFGGLFLQWLRVTSASDSPFPEVLRLSCCFECFYINPQWNG